MCFRAFRTSFSMPGGKCEEVARKSLRLSQLRKQHGFMTVWMHEYLASLNYEELAVLDSKDSK